MDGLKHSREKKGLKMGQQLHEKLEGILIEGHSNRIKKLKVRLNKADKVDERKVHFKILELISRYEQECLPREERRRFTDKTKHSFLRAEYHRMIM